MHVFTLAPVTAIYAALLAILLVTLGLLVVRTRIREQVSLGDGGSKPLLGAMRAHGNAAENIPVAILLLLLLELNGGSDTALHAWGSVLVLGRLAHAVGLYRVRKVNLFRQLGMVATWTAMLGLAVSLLLRAF